jgi:hypothetical protein
MAEKLEVQQGTLALMILKTLEGLGSLHGYGIARRIEETTNPRTTGARSSTRSRLPDESSSPAKHVNGTRPRI